jgi:phosphoribosyl 1,2-cyclic phosphate phosphodiesterase
LSNTLTFLGTGTSQGVPVIGCTCEVCTSLDFRDKRLRTSVWLQIEGKSVVVDPGPDFRQQMLRSGVQSLDAVFVTHEHKDHTGGLDDVRAYNYLQKRFMPVYGQERVMKQLRIDYAYAFESTYPGIPQLELFNTGSDVVAMAGIDFTLLNVTHAGLPVQGLRYGNTAYITDANHISDLEKEKLKGLDMLILNALQTTPHISHFTLDEAVALVEEVGAKQARFVHMSHRIGTQLGVETKLPPHINLAYDTFRIDI